MDKFLKIEGEENNKIMIFIKHSFIHSMITTILKEDSFHSLKPKDRLKIMDLTFKAASMEGRIEA